MIKRSGYLWKTYGFTSYHVWGISLTAGLLVGFATFMLGIALINLIHGKTEHLYIFLYAAMAASLIAIEIIMFSILMLLFFLGADRLGLLEDGKAAIGSTDSGRK
jgi:hypothetical protein